jgi:hypothetical protein
LKGSTVRLFHAKLMDEVLEGDGAAFLPSHPWAYLLPRAEALKFTCIVDDVAGSPTLSLLLYEGLASINWTSEVKTLLDAVSLVSGTNIFSSTYSPLDATNPPSRYLFPEAYIAGAEGKAHVRLWVCGRGPQLLESLGPTAASFPAELEAARRLEDEDRLISHKRLTRAGASQSFQPELFLPSLRWDR